MALSPNARVLVTGASGFLGTHFLQRLLTEKADLHAVNRRGVGPHADRVTWHAADLLDPTASSDLIAHVRPTHLLHNAWMAVPGLFWSDPSNTQWLDAGKALVRAFRSHGGNRFLGIGTCAEYDWDGDRYVEDETPIRPATLYGRSKAEMWEAVQEISENTFSAAWMRVFLPYGPGDSEQRLVRSVISSLRSGDEVALGSGNQLRDFIWAPDIADLAATIFASSETGAFNAGTGIGTSVRAVAEYLGRSIGRPDLLKFGARPDPVSEPAALVADLSKVRETFGWTAKTDVFSGLDVILETV